MSPPIERVYELALRALDEQERQVSDARGRIPPVLAAGGLGVTLLAQPVFDGDHPQGMWEVGAVVIGLLGAAVLVLAALALLRPTRMAFSVDAVVLLQAARDSEIIDEDGRVIATRSSMRRPPWHWRNGEQETPRSRHDSRSRWTSRS